MNNAVFDASVALALVYTEPYTPHARMLFADLLKARRRIYGPTLLPIEMVNVIRKRMRADRMSLERVSALLDDFLSYPITIAQPESIHHRALALTERFSLGGHDAHYVALAEMLGCNFWTGDQRLMRAIGGRLPFVRFVGDYRP